MARLIINKRGYRADFSWLKKLSAIGGPAFGGEKHISIALVSSLEMKKLNWRYRHKNKDTDVLSFKVNTEDTLGEVIICLSRARLQAKEKQHSLKKELQILTIHGILHILGYDHEASTKEAVRQSRAEKQILSKLENYGHR